MKNTLDITPYFTGNEDPLEKIEYDMRSSEILGIKGDTIIKVDKVEVPKSWSQLATDILASKYLKHNCGEYSIKQVINRIVTKISTFGYNNKYFDRTNQKIFENELKYVLVNQYAAFNSPVWFNVGIDSYNLKGRGDSYYYNLEADRAEISKDAFSHPQGSACFITSHKPSCHVKCRFS